ncbi:MAG: DMT family transporter [Desulfuromonadaceae bacterium]
MKALFHIGLAFLIGTLLPVQSAVNARLGQVLQHPLQAALISFSVGTGFLVGFVLLTGIGFPGSGLVHQVPWYLLCGGMLGAVYVTSILMLVPHIGVANVLMAALVGQLFLSMLIDHFGWLGVPVHACGFPRLLGALFLLIGVMLVRQ